VSIDRLRAHYGFSRMPFGKDLAPGMLHAHDSHAQAVARISWCIQEQAIGVISGECGAGKTVAARAAVAGLDASRHTVLYLGTPGVGLRGIYGMIVTRLGGSPKFHHAALIPQAQELLSAEHAERGKRVVLICDEAHLLDAESLEGIRCLSNLGMDQTAPFCLLCSASPRSATDCAKACSPRWIRGSRSATRSAGSPPPRPRATCSITWRLRAAPTRCSPTTPSR